MQYERLKNEIKNKKNYLIYGGGVVAYNVYSAIKTLWDIVPSNFVVTDMEKDDQYVDGISVKRWGSVFEEYDKNIVVLVATPEIYHEEIKGILVNSGYNNFFCIDSHWEYLLMSEYFEQNGNKTLLSDLPLKKNRIDKDVSSNFSVFMAISHKDKKLSRAYSFPNYIIPVQAGYQCTKSKIADIDDSKGENISYKNPNYCELTVTYWSWKNRTNQYMGICHYRRVLLLDTELMNRCVQNNVDVVAPLPFVCYPNATGQYKRYIREKDLLGLRKALEDVSPEYLQIWEEFKTQPYFYNYNMIIAKQSVYAQYCEWLFSVLDRAEKYCDPDENRSDRYAGYLGELLTSLFLYKNSNTLRIAHVEKKWLI